jgi:hypothetical protein
VSRRLVMRCSSGPGNFLPLGPTTLLQTNYSEAFKSNDRGDVVGDYIGGDSAFHGFLLSKVC